MGRGSQPTTGYVVDKAIAEMIASGDVLLASQFNQPNGVPQLDASGDLVGFVETYSDTEANLKGEVIPEDTLVYATDTLSYFKGDGVTSGGIFQFARPRFFGNGANGVSSTVATQLTSTTSVALESITLPADSTYRIYGNANFSGDSDLKSNFRLSFNKGAGQWSPWLVPASGFGGFLQTFQGTYEWAHDLPLVGGTQQGQRTPLMLRSGGPSSNMVLTPIDLTKSNGTLFFDFMFGFAVNATFNVQAALRQAMVGTPTIVVDYAFVLERLQ